MLLIIMPRRKKSFTYTNMKVQTEYINTKLFFLESDAKSEYI